MTAAMKYCYLKTSRLLSLLTFTAALLVSTQQSFCLNVTETGKTGLADAESELSVYMHTGKMTGEANEYVMDGDSVLSRLIWKIDEVYMTGGGLNWKPSSGISLQADLWLKAADGQATMDDYDWLISGEDWTHWSHHNDTAVTKAVLFDISFTYTPEKFRDTFFKLKSIIGYKLTDFEWRGRRRNIYLHQ